MRCRVGIRSKYAMQNRESIARKLPCKQALRRVDSLRAQSLKRSRPWCKGWLYSRLVTKRRTEKRGGKKNITGASKKRRKAECMTGSLKCIDPKAVPSLWLSVVDLEAKDGKRRQSKSRRRFAKRKDAERWHGERLVAAQNGTLEGTREKRKRIASERERAKAETIDASVTLAIARARDDRECAIATIDDYEKLQQSIQRAGFGDVSVRGVDLEKLDAIFKGLRERGRAASGGLGTSRTRKSKVVLTMAFDEAVRKKIISSNPLARYRLVLPVVAERKPPTPEEVEALIAAAVGTYGDLRLPILLAMGCGVRAGEMLALKWSAVDLRTRRNQDHRERRGSQFLHRAEETKNGARHAYHCVPGVRHRRPSAAPPRADRATRSGSASFTNARTS